VGHECIYEKVEGGSRPSASGSRSPLTCSLLLIASLPQQSKALIDGLGVADSESGSARRTSGTHAVW
jgi:hypothetical protein